MQHLISPMRKHSRIKTLSSGTSQDNILSATSGLNHQYFLDSHSGAEQVNQELLNVISLGA